MQADSAYRWVVVSAGALILALAMGAMVNGMSAFILPFETARGWDRAEVSMINAIGILGLAFGGILGGRLADRFGARTIVSTGVIVLGLAYLSAAAVAGSGALWHLYAIFAIAGAFGAGFIFAPVLAIVGNWFKTGAGLAIGIVSGGQAAGQGGVPFGSAALIERVGPATTLALTGAAILVVLLPLALLLRPPPPGEAGGPAQPLATELPTRTIVTYLSLGIILCCTCMATPLMHLVPLIQDACGAALSEASGVLFGMLLIAILGRVAFGKLADMIGALPAYMTATAWMTALIYGFVLMGTLPTFTIYALVYGFGYAGVMTGVLVSIRTLVRPSDRGMALGIVTMFGWFGHAIGGFQGGWLYELSGDYRASFGLAAAAGLVNLAIIFHLYLRTRGEDGLSPRPA